MTLETKCEDYQPLQGIMEYIPVAQLNELSYCPYNERDCSHYLAMLCNEEFGYCEQRER